MQTLRAELDNVDKHYVRREAGLQAELAALEEQGMKKEEKTATLAEIRKGIQDLTNFAALNYSAVLKAVKKRNRRLQMACGDSVVTAPTRDFLVGRRFFASNQLAKIIAAAHTLTQVCPAYHYSCAHLACCSASCPHPSTSNAGVPWEVHVPEAHARVSVPDLLRKAIISSPPAV